MEPTRELFWNISGYWVMYPLLAIVAVFFVFFYVRRVRLWRLGIDAARTDNPAIRLKGAFRDSILQLRVLGEKKGGIIHLTMYVGMLVLLAATAITAADADFGLDLVKGDLYLYFLSLATDIAGLLFCAGMIAALVRRALNARKGLETSVSDIVVLVALLLIGISGFCVEGLRIVGTDDPWRAWSPVGNAFSFLFVGLSPDAIRLAHRLLWWGHMILAFVVIATWTYGKLVHALLVPVAVYRRPLGNKAELPFVDIEAEDLESMGVCNLTDFTQKDLLDAEACIRCGRCVDNCPANISGKELSPKAAIAGLRSVLESEGPRVLAERSKRGKEGNNDSVGAGYEGSPLVGSMLSENALWQCTTCGACQAQCPAMIEVPTKIVKLRTYQVSMEGSFPRQAQHAFRALETNGNPWGLGWQTRTRWVDECRGMGLRVPTLSENPHAEYLYWPGCSGAFDSRNKKVTVALVKILNEAGVDFAILGNEEKCCGDSARRLGNEYAYFMLAAENIETLNSYGVKKIIVQCPHCMTSLSVDYPQMGGIYEVIHHSVLIKRLIDEGRLSLRREGGPGTITYHDSCYLGRYNEIYDEPREVLRRAGAVLEEMRMHGDKSFCCGAGGGQMWLEENEGSRLNRMRAHQAIETGADEACTACPFCLTMLTDGIAAQGSDFKVRDIAEVVAACLAGRENA